MTKQGRTVPPPAAAQGSAGNLGIATQRFLRVWARGAPGAAYRRFRRTWPLWLAGGLLALFSAWILDGPSVQWVRELPPAVRSFFRAITDYGKSGWLLYPSGLLCIALVLADWHKVERRVAAAWTEIGILAGYVFFSIAGSGIVANVIKQFVGRGRPSLFDEHGAFAFLPFQYNYAHASFPSGHATTMGALAVVIATIAPRLSAPALLICGVVAASRVFVGSHYPSDVVAGFMLGASFTWFYAIALALAGIGFAMTGAGTIRARTAAIRGIFGRKGGLVTALRGLRDGFAARVTGRGASA